MQLIEFKVFHTFYSLIKSVNYESILQSIGSHSVMRLFIIN